jgi:hypothetical protein
VDGDHRAAPGTVPDVSGVDHGEPDRLAARLEATTSAVRRMPRSRLAAALPAPWGTRAQAARILARTLALAAQGIEEADRRDPPQWRALPMLPDTGVGDQLAVLAHDLLVAVREAPPQVWTPDGRAPLADVVSDVAATLDEVARLL